MKWISACLISGAALIWLAPSSANAACTSFPNPLTNGTTADGSQVIANLTYMSGCLAPLSTPTFSGDVTVNGGLLEYGNGIAVFSTNAYGAGISMQNQATGHTWHVRYDGGSLLGHPDYFTIFDGTAGSRLTIDTAGNVGIGTTSPGYMLTVAGTAYAAGAAGALSDRRHKTDIHDLTTDALDIVEHLKPVRFLWKHPADSGMRGQQLGFIAQDVQRIAPTLVITETNAEKTLGLKYNEFIPILTKAVQEQQSEIMKLRAQNADQASLLLRMKAQISALSNKVAHR